MKKANFINIVNKKARHEYEVLETLEAGIVLTGPEVKSVRLGRVQLKDGYVVVAEGEARLMNVHISRYDYSHDDEYEPNATRTLLLKRKEIERLRGKLALKGLAAVPLRVYEKGNRFKVEIGIVRGKKQYEKREKKKREDIKREVETLVKAKMRG